MEIITSRQNEKIKFIKKLQNKKERKESGLFVIETEKLINEAYNCGYEIVEAYYTNSEPKFNVKHNFKINASVMEYISSLSTPSTMLAVVRQKQKPPQGNKCLVLENIQDPSNLGAIIRTAFGADFLTVYLVNCADAYEMKALRSCMGATFHISVIETTLQQVENLKDYTFICASMEGENIYKQSITDEKIALVIGNEGHGVSAELRKKCNKTVSIPMSKGLESLNASVSAGLIMYAIKYNLKENK